MTKEELIIENERLKARLEKAKQYFYEQKSEQENLLALTEGRIKATTYRNTQKTRDALYVIARRLNGKEETVLTSTEVKNLRYCLMDIINNLQQNQLWDSKLDADPFR